MHDCRCNVLMYCVQQYMLPSPGAPTKLGIYVHTNDTRWGNLYTYTSNHCALVQIISLFVELEEEKRFKLTKSMVIRILNDLEYRMADKPRVVAKLKKNSVKSS